MNEVIAATLGTSGWQPTPTSGLDYVELRQQEGGGSTIFLRFAKGTRGRAHNHPGGEDIYVVSGDITIGGKRLKAGDYLYTPPGVAHDAVAHEETVLFVSLPKAAVFL
jgi:quercetin dioxygenase-like cupin family protein